MKLGIMLLCANLVVVEPIVALQDATNVITENSGKIVETISTQCYNDCSERIANVLLEIEEQQNAILPITTEYEIINHNGKKCYERYTALKRGNQKLLQQYCTTDTFGFRGYNGRYCVAVGTRFNMPVGQYFDAVLENGVIIPCVVGDIKADIHTDITNTFSQNGCCLEFIVDGKELDETVKYMGDVSYLSDEFNSNVVKFIVYDELNAIAEINLEKGAVE